MNKINLPYTALSMYAHVIIHPAEQINNDITIITQVTLFIYAC